MIPIFLEEGSTALVTKIETDLAGTIKTNGRNLPVKNPITYMSSPAIVLNDPTDDRDDTYDIDDIAINVAWDAVVEPMPDRDGSLAGEPREIQKIIRIKGWVRGQSLAHLYDKINDLNRAFNPMLTFNSDLEAGSDFDIGFVPLKFYTPTTNTTAFPNGFIAHQYYVRSLSVPVDVSTKFDDYNARFNIVLLAVDGRKYEQTTQLYERTGAGLGFSVDNDDATYPSWPTVKMTFVGAPSADIAYNYAAGEAATELSRIVRLEADELTDAAGKTLVIDHQYRRAYYEASGADKTAAIKGSSRFFQIVPGTNLLNITGMDADVAVDIIWRRAFI